MTDQTITVQISFRTAFKGGHGFTCGMLAVAPLLGFIIAVAATAIDTLRARRIFTPAQAFEAYGFEGAVFIILAGVVAYFLLRK